MKPLCAKAMAVAVTVLGWVGAVGATAIPCTAYAGTASTVHTPIVDFREWELELKYGVQDWNDPEVGKQAAVFEVAYGVAPRWKTGLELGLSRVPGQAGRVDVVEFENVFQLTEQGRYWLDAGIFTELAHHRVDGETTFEIGPMLQKDIGQNQVNLNLLLERRLDSPGPGESIHTEVGYQAQWKWYAHPKLQPGLQVFGKLGDLGNLHSVELRAGPALFGVVRLGDARNLKYDFAIMAGLTHDTPDTTVRFRIEYEFF